jgi:bifunctional DNase/RNase
VVCAAADEYNEVYPAGLVFFYQLQEKCLPLAIRKSHLPLGKVEPMPMQMELSRIIINEINDQQVIYLREVDGERMFPILIGIFEATSIDRRVKDIPTPRPLTHDLLVNLVETMGGEFQDVVISELREHTYYSVLRVRHEGELLEIDARPSDAIAVAVTCDLPIYVNEEVLNDIMGE